MPFGLLIISTAIFRSSQIKIFLPLFELAESCCFAESYTQCLHPSNLRKETVHSPPHCSAGAAHSRWSAGTTNLLQIQSPRFLALVAIITKLNKATCRMLHQLIATKLKILLFHSFTKDQFANVVLRRECSLLQSVIAHELGHLKCDHGVWLSLANIFANGTASVLPVISGAVEEGLLRSCLYTLTRSSLALL